MTRVHFLSAVLMLACAACVPSGGQPKFNLTVLPSATSIPMAGATRVAATLPERITSFDVSPNGSLLAVATIGGMKLYDLHSYQLLRTLNDGEFTSRVAWSPDGSRLAIGGTKNYGKPFFVGGDSSNSNKAHLTVWDTATWKIVFEPAFGNEMVNQMFYDMAWSPDGTRLVATNDMAYTMRRWKVSGGQFVRLFDQRSSAYRVVEWSQDGARIASGDGRGGLCFWTAATNQCDGFIHAHRTATFSLAWSPDGNWMATGGGVIRIWDTRTGALVRAFGEDNTLIYQRLQWLRPNGPLVSLQASIEGANATALRLWKISSGALIAEFRGG